MRNGFYVYEHWRPDTDLPFYVGKGKGGRSRQFRRNVYYNRVVAKLASLGLCVEVRVVSGGLQESEAFSVEKDRIAFWKKSGVRLTNMTDGGEGMSNPSPETRFLIGSGKRGKPVSEETKSKLSAAQNKRFSDPAERAKCVNPVEVLKGNPILQKGRIVSGETRLALSKSHTGITASESAKAAKSVAMRERHRLFPMTAETKAKIGAKHVGNTHALGCVRSQETRAKMREAQRTRFANKVEA